MKVEEDEDPARGRLYEQIMRGRGEKSLRKDAKTRCQLWRGFSTAAKKSQEESATTTTATIAATGKQSNKNKAH